MRNSFCCNFAWNDTITSLETRSREQNVQQGEEEGELGLAVDLVEEEKVEEEEEEEVEVVRAGS